ncbi:importin subunit alpha [Anaeramoeba flamelloides]|uniref:Importin subunit alpha n=1 Tax=Anaeramoeba flamelloides TaxID=1746091 RepID=A0AAV8A7A1_9EUKA|nr:importin subunit alpha [Anaeramoeba flamelloides]
MNNFQRKLKRRQQRYKNKTSRIQAIDRRINKSQSFSRTRRDEILSRKRNLNFNNVCKEPTICNKNEIKNYVRQIIDGCQNEQQFAIGLLKEFTYGPNPYFSDLIFHHVPELLNEILGNKEIAQVIKIDALWMVANFSCSASLLITKEMIKTGIILTLLNLLSCNKNDHEIIEITLLALGNLLQDCNDSKNEFLTNGSLGFLLNLYTIDYPAKIYQDITWVLTTLCQGALCNKLETYSTLIEAFTQLLKEKDRHLLRIACSGLAGLGDHKELFSYFCTTNTFEHLANLLQSNGQLSNKDYKTKQITLFTISQLIKNCSKNSTITHVFEKYEIIQTLSDQIKNSNRPSLIVPDIILVLKRATQGGSKIIQDILSSRILTRIFQLLQQQQEAIQQQNLKFKSKTLSNIKHMQHELSWMLFRLSSHCDQNQFSSLIEQGAFQIISQLLKEIHDLSILKPTLKTINHFLISEIFPILDFLDETNSLKIIEALTHHQNNKITHLSTDIIDNFFICHSLVYEKEIEKENTLIEQQQRQQFHSLF